MGEDLDPQEQPESATPPPEIMEEYKSFVGDVLDAHLGGNNSDALLATYVRGFLDRHHGSLTPEEVNNYSDKLLELTKKARANPGQ